MKKYALALTLSALAAAGAHVSLLAQGPPQFLTRPILLHVGEDGLDHGHFIFAGEESAIPGPLAPNYGTATFDAAATGGEALLTGGDGAGINPDVNVSNSPDSYEGETGATGSVSASGLIVAGSNHIYPGNCSASAATGTFGDCAPLAYASTDGATFTRTALPRVWNNTTFGIGFDPAVDVDSTGTFYYSYGVAPLSGSYPNAIVVAKSADGVHWTKAAPVTFNRNKAFDDKYYMAIDRSARTFNDRIYVSWDRNQGNNQTLYLAYSSNGGATWSAPIKVNDGTTGFERVIGAYPAVDQNTGVVYDSWHDYARNVIFVDKSSSGGATWGRDVAATTTHAGFGKDIGCVGTRSQGPAHALKVGSTGVLYLVYADPVNGRGFDVLMTRSANGGATWSTPVSLNDDAGAADQFHPTLSVEPNGLGGDKVTVTFYDRRDDPANCAAHVYATQSTDGGVTWSANVRETTQSSNFDGNTNGPGDYSSSTPSLGLGGVFPFFSDHRASNPQTAAGGGFDVYTVKVQ
jgi:hypothetical protein